MQITITDHNEWEGEDFSFVMEMDEQLANQISNQASSSMSIEFNTSYSQQDIDRINDHSDNGYMERIGFYELKPQIIIVPGIDFYDQVFYKACGLINLKDKH